MDTQKDPRVKELIPTLDEWFLEFETVALATVTRTWGSSPRPAGSHMIVSPDGKMAGSVSGGCVEGAVVEAALEMLREDSGPQMLDFGVADELAWNVGLACGGRINVWLQRLGSDPLFQALRQDLLAGNAVVLTTALGGAQAGTRQLRRANGAVLGNLNFEACECRELEEVERSALAKGEPGAHELYGVPVFVQPYLPPPRLIVIGAVHTAVPLVTIAQTLGFTTTVVDARAAFATRERFPGADELLVEWPDTALARLEPDPNTAVVVLTHETKFDEPALTAALGSPAGYIGAIGSRATSADRLVRLRALGYTSEQLERIHGPIGLDIGGATPAEIALSIMAEIVAVRHNRTGRLPGLMAGDRVP